VTVLDDLAALKPLFDYPLRDTSICKVYFVWQNGMIARLNDEMIEVVQGQTRDLPLTADLAAA
jgi:hypothetical protein